MLNKKALTFDVIMFTFFKMLILMTVLFSVVMMIRVFIVATVEVDEAEAEILLNNMLSSSGGIAYRDAVTGRVYPMIINISEFADSKAMEKRLSETLFADRRGIAAQLSIKDPKTKDLYQYNGAALDKLYYHKDDYSKWIVLARAKAKGAGGATEWILRRDVVLIGAESGRYGMLEASIVIPNS